jgi:hypothetical protein
MFEPEVVLGRREAGLRAAAVACLTGVALVQALGLAALFTQSRLLGVLSLTAMTLCIALGWTLAAAPAGASRRLWRLVAVAAALVVVGWAAPRALAVPGLPGSRGRWTAMPGAASVALAGVALALALVAARPTRASARGLLTAAALLAAMAPGTGVLLVATAPGPPGGEAALAAGGHAHHATGSRMRMLRMPKLHLQPGSGRHGGRYVITATSPRQGAFDVALIALAALVFASAAIACLRRRSAAWGSAPAPGLL